MGGGGRRESLYGVCWGKGGGLLAKVIVLTSGKGGVGKTTSAAAIAAGLALRGKRTVVIDFDVGLRNLDLIMGCERRVVFDFINVINGDAKLNQALIKDKRNDNLYIFPTSQTRDKDALKREGVERVLEELKQQFDFIICDSPAGIEHGAVTALYFADAAIIVTNPEVSSVRDSDRIIGILASRSRRAERNEPPAIDALRPHAGRQRRDADRRGRPGNPVGAAARRYSGIGIGVARVEHRHAGRLRRGQPGRQGISRRRRPFPRRAARDALCATRASRLLPCPIWQGVMRIQGMRLLNLVFPPRPKSAAIAKERLKIVLAHERAGSHAPDFLPRLQKELIDVVGRYVEIRDDMIRVSLDKAGETSLLEINIEIEGAKPKIKPLGSAVPA